MPNGRHTLVQILASARRALRDGVPEDEVNARLRQVTDGRYSSIAELSAASTAEPTGPGGVLDLPDVSEQSIARPDVAPRLPGQGTPPSRSARAPARFSSENFADTPVYRLGDRTYSPRQVLRSARSALDSDVSEDEVNARLREATSGDFETVRDLENQLSGASARYSEHTPIANYLRSMAQGATFGFADELAGVGAALVPGGRGYSEAVEGSRQRIEDLRAVAPTATLLGELAGGVIVPAAVGSRVLHGAGSYVRAAGASGLTGLIEGAIYGAGEAEGGASGRAKGAAIGAGMGGVLGAVAGPLTYAGARVVRSLVHRAGPIQRLMERFPTLRRLAPDLHETSSLLNQDPYLQRPIVRGRRGRGARIASELPKVEGPQPLARTFEILDTERERIQRVFYRPIEHGRPNAPGGRPFSAELWHGGRRAGPDQVEFFSGQRAVAADAGEVVQASVELQHARIVPKDELPALMDDLAPVRGSKLAEATGREESAALEAARRGYDGIVVIDPVQGQVLDVIVPPATRVARPGTITDRAVLSILEDPDVAPHVRAVSKQVARGERPPTFEEIQRVRQRLRKGERAKPELGAAADELTNALHDMDPRIARADAAWAELQDYERALEAGRKLYTKSAATIERELRKYDRAFLGPADRTRADVMRDGMIYELARRLETSEPFDMKAFRNLFEAGPEMEAKWRAMFGDQGYEHLRQVLHQEQSAETIRKWLVRALIGTAGAGALSVGGRTIVAPVLRGILE